MISQFSMSCILVFSYDNMYGNICIFCDSVTVLQYIKYMVVSLSIKNKNALLKKEYLPDEIVALHPNMYKGMIENMNVLIEEE